MAQVSGQFPFNRRMLDFFDVTVSTPRLTMLPQENRIATERGRFNEVVGAYNSLIVTFPGNLFAGLFGFKEKGFFQGAEGTEKAPDISFE